MNLGDEFPNTVVETTHGTFKLHDYQGLNRWLVFFAHPADFTPVCTSELAKFHDEIQEFKTRRCKLIGYSVDTTEVHHQWAKDVLALAKQPGDDLSYPIISDQSRALAVELGMLDAVAKDKDGILNLCRAVFIVGPDKKLRLSTLYPASVGRNVTEIIRTLDALQLAERHPIATPVDWESGDTVMLSPELSNTKAAKIFPGYRTVELPSGKTYMRYVNSPPLARTDGR